MMSFLMPFIVWKAIFETIFLGLSNMLQHPSHHAFQWRLVQNIYNIFNPNAPKHRLRISWCLLTSYATPSTFNVFVPTIVQKQILMFDLVSLFDSCTITCHFVIPCRHSYLFIISCLLSSLVLFKCVFVIDQV
jgi:hypothetical protein